MSRIYQLLVCNLLLLWTLTACSTPGTRGRAHASALRRLSPADQQIVLHGHIRPGMSPDAVYIAWGSPDAKTSGGGDKAAAETWVYRQRVTLYEPMNSYYYQGPYHGFGEGNGGRGFLPGYAYGGVGYEGALRSQPHVRSLDSVRIAEFSGGKVDRYKSADGRWSAPQGQVAGGGHAPVGSLTALYTPRKLPHVAYRSSQSARPQHDARLALRHPRHPVVPAGSAHGIHRLHHARHEGAGKKGGVRTAAAGGPKAGAKQSGAQGPHAGRALHRVGHAQRGAPGQPKPGTA